MPTYEIKLNPTRANYARIGRMFALFLEHMAHDFTVTITGFQVQGGRIRLTTDVALSAGFLRHIAENDTDLGEV